MGYNYEALDSFEFEKLARDVTEKIVGQGLVPRSRSYPALPDRRKKGVNAPDADRHIELPIGNKTNIVSIMLTKGWL